MIGRIMGERGPLTFMVLCPSLNPAFRPSTIEVVLLDGETLFDGRIHRLGDIGPVFVGENSREIEWLE